ncbi:MAG: tetratricopeptide repeat protein [Chloroflexi bacterium]|nr:tetratricopeptide repeat protein [Chloroflexota bacterium]
MPGREEVFLQAMSAGHSAAWDQDWERAARSYRQALEEIPDQPKALSNLGLALFQLQRYDEALQSYRRAAQVSPVDPIPLEKIAQLSERLGDLKGAVQAAMQAADLYIRTQEADKAIENWLRVTQLDSGHIPAHNNLAMVHEKLGHTQQAVTEYLAIASLLQRAGQADKCAEMVGRALRLMPASAEARQAQSLLKSGQLLPVPARSKGGTGPLRMSQVKEMGKTQPAERLLDPVSEARQKALTRLAEVLFEYSDDGSPAAARRGMQAIMRGATGQLSLQKNDRTRILLHLSQAIDEQTNGQEAQAAEELEKAIEAGFKEPAAYFDLGLLRFKANRLESALRNLQRSVKHQDYALGARLVMGGVYLQMGRLKEAVVEYMEALKCADAAVVPADQADSLRQLYEPLVEAQSAETDTEAMERLCQNVSDLLLQPDWRSKVSQARSQLPKAADGAPPTPLAEMLAHAQSSQVIGAIHSVHELARAGRLRSAMDEAFTALRYAPTYLPLHALIGDILIREGRTQDAIAKFSVVAQAYNVRGESVQAANTLKRIIQLAPMDLPTRTRLIEQLSARGQLDEALNEYIDLADIYCRLAELDMARKTYTIALRTAQQSSANREWSVRILRRMADIDMQRLDWKQALRVYEQIRTLQPDEQPTRRNLVDINLRLGQKGQAAAEIENYTAYLESAGRRAEAIPFLENLAGEAPNQDTLRTYLAEEYRLAGRTEEAVAQLDALAELLLDGGDRGGAIRTVELIIGLGPAKIDSYRNLLANLQGGA